MLRWLIALLCVTPAFGCLCIDRLNPCKALDGSTRIFVGRVLVDGGNDMHAGPSLVAIEEPIANVPSEIREVRVHSMAGTSCYYPLRAGERHLFVAWQDAVHPSDLRIGLCSHSFSLKGMEFVLDALREQASGGARSIVGVVVKTASHDSISGARVLAVSDRGRFEATTDSDGRFALSGMQPGRYRIEVSKDGFVADGGADIVEVGAKCCAVRLLPMRAR